MIPVNKGKRNILASVIYIEKLQMFFCLVSNDCDFLMCNSTRTVH